MKNIIVTIAIIIIGFTFANAQSADRKMSFQPGDVVCSSNGKLVGGDLYASKSANAENFVGVYSGKPVGTETRRDEVFVSTGTALVNVSGSVKKGDYITTGEGGKAVKANESGYVIGIAMEDSQGGKVKVALKYEYAVIK